AGLFCPAPVAGVGAAAASPGLSDSASPREGLSDFPQPAPPAPRSPAAARPSRAFRRIQLRAIAISFRKRTAGTRGGESSLAPPARQRRMARGLPAGGAQVPQAAVSRESSPATP